jgi:hypothetical protein
MNTIKKMNVMLAALFAMGVMAQAQNTELKSTLKDDLFAGTEIFAKNATDVTEISMDPDSLDRVSGNHASRARTELLHVVREYTYDKPGMYDMAEVDKFRNKLDTGDWHCSVHERHLKSGTSTDVCAKHRTDDLKETAIIEVAPKELTFIHMIVKRGPNDQSELSGLWMGPLRGLPSMAMLDPEILQLKYQLNSLKYQLGAMPPMTFDLSPQIDMDAIKRSIDKATKDWNKSGDKMKDQLKQFTSPDGAHTFVIAPEVPPAPSTPPAPLPK